VAHHKRRRHKSARAGCICGGKIYKHNGFKGTGDAVQARDRRAMDAMDPVEAPTPPARSGRKTRKPWVVEYRTDPSKLEEWERGLSRWPHGPGDDWTVYGRYATERARDDALHRLRAKAAGGCIIVENCEFRPSVR